MVTATGRHITGGLTETGRAAFSTVSETGEYAPTTAPIRTKLHLTGLLTVGGPGYSRQLSSSLTLAEGVTRSVAGLLTVGGPGYSRQLSSVLELMPYNPPQHAQVSCPHPHASTATVYALLTLCGHTTRTISSVLTVGGPGTTKAVAGLLSLSGDSKTISSLLAIDPPPNTRQISVPVPLEKYAGTRQISVPLSLDDPPTIAGLTDYRITLDGVDITRLVDDCTMQYDDGTMFATVSISLPVAVALPSVTGRVIVTVAGVDHHYQMEDVEASGPSRTIWGRSIAAVIDAPFAVESSWDESMGPPMASDLAGLLAGDVPLDWQAFDWPLPPAWSLSGTPAEALQQLAAAVGAVVRSTPAGGLVVAPRFTVRPVAQASAATVADISRETALKFTARQQHGKGWGSITISGYDPSADLPRLDIEESSPVHGQPVHVRARWRSKKPPPYNNFITDGSAIAIGSGDEIVEEQVVFDSGVGSVQHPIRDLLGFYWVGRNGGTIWWLENGNSTELEMTDPEGYGVAMVRYATAYGRFRLTEQTEEIVQFGLSVSAAAVSARVRLASGGPVAPQLINPLLATTAAAVAAGTAALDAERDRWIIAADVPLTGPELVTGALVRLHDELAGIIGTGQITGVTTKLTPGKTEQAVEAILCN